MQRTWWLGLVMVAACGTDGGKVDDTDAVVDDTDTVDTDVVDTDTDLVGPSLDDLGPGDLIVSEVMANPAACPDAEAEYIELLNTSASAVDVDGLHLDDDIGTFVVHGSHVIAAGGRLLVARSATGLAACYGVTPDVAWDRDLHNSADEIKVSTPSGTVLDDVRIHDLLGTRFLESPPGVAFERDDAAPATWCTANTPIGATSDLGTPGAANGDCAEVADSDVDTQVQGVLGLADLSAGDLVLTEVMLDPTTCSDAIGEYVEVLYQGPGDADLRGLVVKTATSRSTALGTLRVSPGERLVLGRALTLCGGWSASADAAYSGLAMVAGDTVQLTDGGTRVFDQVATAGWQGTSGIARERDDVDPTSWCPSDTPLGTSRDKGSPGAANGTCPPVDTDTGGPIETDDGLLHPDQLGAGDLVVTEFMSDPVDCGADPDGEWIELRYEGPAAADLTGVTVANARFVDVLTDPGGPIVVEPGDLVLLVNSRVTPTCHALSGVPIRNVLLRNAPTGDTITVSYAGVVFDTVDYRGAEIPPGVAWQREESGAWCGATDAIELGKADLGTPGLPNPLCPLVDSGDTGDTTQPLHPRDLREGALRITEVMADPEACANADGQYVELAFDGKRDVELMGLQVAVGRGTPVRVTTSLPMAPGDRVVLARSLAGYAACYGRTADFELGVGLAVTGDTLRLLDDRGRELDALATGVAAQGIALERDDTDPTLVCRADKPIGATADLGSPGRTNGACAGGTVAAGRTAADLAAGELRVTEVMGLPAACGAASEYVELAYQGTGTVDLDGLVVTTTDDVVVLRGPVVAPGDRVLLARGDGDVASCYGATPDQLAAFTLDDAGDTVSVWTPDGERLDQADLAAALPGVAREQDDVVVDRWCVADSRAGTSADLGTPGAPNGGCPSSPRLVPDELSPGDLRVTEWMPNPAACADADAEYVELHYVGTAPADLAGLVVRYDGSSTRLSASLPVDPGARVLLGRAGPAFTACWGRAVDAPLSFVMEGATGAPLSLVTPGGKVLASVPLEALEVVAGAAWELDETTDLWCEADGLLPNGDHGSPGAANGLCTFGDTGLPVDTDALSVDDLVPGDLVITEVMADPTAGIDGACEYTEVLYLGADPVDLSGLLVQDDGTLEPVVVAASVVLAQGQRALLVPDPLAFPACYGKAGIGVPGISLGNTTGDVIRLLNDGGELDRYDFRGPRAPAGRSLTRDEGKATPTWCVTPSGTRIGATVDAGTPGARGPACP